MSPDIGLYANIYIFCVIGVFEQTDSTKGNMLSLTEIVPCVDRCSLTDILACIEGKTE